MAIAALARQATCGSIARKSPLWPPNWIWKFPRNFEQRYVHSVGIRKSLVERGNGDCVFFDGEKRKCTVYGARPRQCRSWPFWESNVRTPAAWEQTCQACPGSGKGNLVSSEQILHQVSLIRICSSTWLRPGLGPAQVRLAPRQSLCRSCSPRRRSPWLLGQGMRRFFGLVQVCRSGSRYHWSSRRPGRTERVSRRETNGCRRPAALSASCLTDNGYAPRPIPGGEANDGKLFDNWKLRLNLLIRAEAFLVHC